MKRLLVLIVDAIVASGSMLLLLDQELISYRYRSCSCTSSCWGDLFKKRPSLHRSKSDWDKIWQDCSSRKYSRYCNKV